MLQTDFPLSIFSSKPIIEVLNLFEKFIIILETLTF